MVVIVNVYVLEYKRSLVKLPNEVLANRGDRGALVTPTVSVWMNRKSFASQGFPVITDGKLIISP